MKTYIIAEAGVNHNGNLDMAYKLVDVAVESGADAVKFQTAIPELVMTRDAKKAEYQDKNDPKSESQIEMAKRIHLPLEAYNKLNDYCVSKNIDFLSTPFDSVSIKYLADLGQTVFKIPSGEITNLPYLRQVCKVSKKVILSTGMCTLQEVRNAVNVILDSGIKPENLSVLHCTTQYPTPYLDVNLNAMLTIKKELNVNVGYSDHTLGIEIPIAAVALGAIIIEKHFTLDNTLEGPDHLASLEPQELKEMVRQIRNIEVALGSGEKVVQQSEKANIAVARKSIVAYCDIKKGEIFSEDNLTTKRPGTGINPMKWDDIIGTVASKDFKEDELITL